MNDLPSVNPGPDTGLVELSADIVSAYVSHNALSASDLPKLITEVHRCHRVGDNEAQRVSRSQHKKLRCSPEEQRASRASC